MGVDTAVGADAFAVRATSTVAATAVATSDVGALILGEDSRYGPASDNDLASVGEIIYS